LGGLREEWISARIQPCGPNFLPPEQNNRYWFTSNGGPAMASVPVHPESESLGEI
jgi:hypothetical protein